MTVLSGLEVLLGAERQLLKGKRFALLSHAASVDRSLRSAAELLREAYPGGLVRLFAPEHGVEGTLQDMAHVAEASDAGSGLAVVSLYGDDESSLRPSRQALAGLDAVVCDLQDVGSRYYTFQATIALVMSAAQEADVEVVVLDRPNPLGGERIEGPGIESGFSSFVGIEPVPVRHGLTVAELARYYASERGRECRLTVVPMAGWRRRMWFDDTGLPWVMPSPNMPTLDTAIAYPGSCLIEGTNLSEGRGTTRPLEIMGAPWLSGRAVARELEREGGLAGVAFRALGFRPTFQKHAGCDCGGVQLHVTDRGAFEPFLTGIGLVRAARAVDPARFDWRRETYEFVSDRLAFDLLTGSSRLREGIEAGESLAALKASWAGEPARFAERRRRYLLYPD